MKFDLNILNDYIAKGLLEVNYHPNLPLSIWNYTRECQFLQVWDDITLECRGLVLDNEGNVVAKTFRKFFNMEEIPTALIPNEPFEVFEKMDGSLGIIFYYNNEWHIATRGSFVSDQAIKGKEILNKYNLNNFPIIPEDYTYLVEIIYPENRIVCSYGNEEKLVLLGVIDNIEGKEVDRDLVEIISFSTNIPVVKKYHGITDYKTLKALVKDDQEGFIVRFKSGFRMKVKGAEYVRLHRLLTNFSNVDIWEALRKGEDINKMLERVPDEFDVWVRKTIKELQYARYRIEEHCGKIHDYFRYGKYSDVDPEPTKKEFAEFVSKIQEKYYHGILFAMWDGNEKKWNDIIWKLIRPTYQKPFWNKEDEE